MPEENFDSTGSRGHSDLTRRAILQIAVDFLQEINQCNNYTNGSILLTAEGLIHQCYGATADFEYFDLALREIEHGAIIPDLNEDTKFKASIHFDAEQIAKGHKILQQYFKETVHLVNDEHYNLARIAIGQALHTLQDFYSHTTWVELRNLEPNFNLGLPGAPLLVQVAYPDEVTCRPCISKFATSRRNRFSFDRGKSSGNNQCPSTLISSDLLTSGFSIRQKFKAGYSILQLNREGKCSHGGILDKYGRVTAHGGINKDTASPSFSPHYHMHRSAAHLALRASIYWLRELKKVINDDQKFMQLLHTTPATSIAFVIDVSPSMSAYVEEIGLKIREILQILSGSIERPPFFLLAPFSRDTAGPVFMGPEPIDLPLKYPYHAFRDIQEAESAKAYTSEKRKTYEALIKVIRKSLIGGRIFLITDGQPSDTKLATEFYVLARSRHVVIEFVQVAKSPSPNLGNSKATPESCEALETKLLWSIRFCYSNTTTYNLILDHLENTVRESFAKRTVLLAKSGFSSDDFTFFVPVVNDNLEIFFSTKSEVKMYVLSSSGRSAMIQWNNWSEKRVRFANSVTGPWKIILEVIGDPVDCYCLQVSVLQAEYPKARWRLMEFYGKTLHPGRLQISAPLEGSCVDMELILSGGTFPLLISWQNASREQDDEQRLSMRCKDVQGGLCFVKFCIDDKPIKPLITGLKSDGTIVKLPIPPIFPISSSITTRLVKIDKGSSDSPTTYSYQFIVKGVRPEKTYYRLQIFADPELQKMEYRPRKVKLSEANSGVQYGVINAQLNPTDRAATLYITSQRCNKSNLKNCSTTDIAKTHIIIGRFIDYDDFVY